MAVTRVMPPGERGGAVGLKAPGGGVGSRQVRCRAVGQIFGWSGLFWITTVLALVPGVLYALPDGAPRDGSEVSHHAETGFAGEGRFDLAGGTSAG